MTLLALPKLRTLNLRKDSMTSALETVSFDEVQAELRYEPAPWSLRSLQHLLKLPNASLAKHGHALAVEVLDEDEEEVMTSEVDSHQEDPE